MAHLAQARVVAHFVLVRQKFFFSHRTFMKVTITTLSGVEAAHLDVDAALQLGDVLALLPSQAGCTECPRRLLFCNTELMGSMRLSDIGVRGQHTHPRMCGQVASPDCFPRLDCESMVDSLRRVLALIDRA